MTNQSPPESPNSIPERRRRPATGVTFDEMIGIIIAFLTIGSLLFWGLSGKNSKLANNFSLGGDSRLSASDKTGDTGLGFGGILSQDTGAEQQSQREQNLEAENRRLATQLKNLQAKSATEVNSAANQTVNPSAVATSERNSNSFSVNPQGKLNAGAKLAPLAGVAVLPGLKGNAGDTPPVKTENNAIDKAPKAAAPEKVNPRASIPKQTAPAKVKPTPITPETTKMPQDVVPDYWAYPFVKQMRDKALVPELAKNQEFDPDALITRASMATLVSQAFAQQPQIKSEKKFADVSRGNAIAKDIDKAVSSGFMQGYSDDEFKPLENIPRYQVLVTLATGLGLKPSQDADQILQKFGDRNNMPDWAKEQVAAATEAGLVVNPPNTDTNSLVPEKPATRGEVAAMIHQALVKTGKLKSLESEYIVNP
jgi:S-layer homology domain